jgi:hypothetical protein
VTTDADDLNRAARDAARDLAKLFRKHWPRLREASSETVRREAPRVAEVLRQELKRAAAELRKRGR